MASYPGAVKTFTTKNAGDTIQPSHINDLQDEVNAIEAGLLNGTANLNSSNSTVANLSVLGGSTLASLRVNGNSTLGSTITIGGVPYQFPTAPASSGLALVVQSTGTPNVLTWGAATVWTRLKAGSGTSSAAGATVVDSVATGALTVLDTLMVFVNILTTTANTGQVTIYDVTDSQILAVVSASPFVAGTNGVETVTTLKQRPGTATAINAFTTGWDMDGGVAVTGGRSQGSLTSWLTGITIGLRHGGVTATGTFTYQWAIYKVSGQ